MPKFSFVCYMLLTCTVKKSFHFKHEIAEAKILHFDLGVNIFRPTSLESPFHAEVKLKFT